LVSGIKDYAIFMLDPDGRVFLWNDGAEHLMGYQAEEIIGQHFSRFYEDDDIRSGVPERGLQAACTAGSFSAEGWRLRKDGSRFLLHACLVRFEECGSPGNQKAPLAAFGILDSPHERIGGTPHRNGMGHKILAPSQLGYIPRNLINFDPDESSSGEKNQGQSLPHGQ
jgi:PAS domain S-box-containing protein